MLLVIALPVAVAILFMARFSTSTRGSFIDTQVGRLMTVCFALHSGLATQNYVTHKDFRRRAPAIAVVTFTYLTLAWLFLTIFG